MPEEFKPIETAEAFETAVQSRINEAVKQYKDWISPEKAAEQTTALQNQIDTLKTANLRMKIAQENNLPSELADRLNGSTEEEIRKDAETLAKFAAPRTAVQNFTAEKPPAADPKTAALREMLKNLKK